MVLKQSKEATPNIIWILDSLQSRLKTKTKKTEKCIYVDYVTIVKSRIQIGRKKVILDIYKTEKWNIYQIADVGKNKSLTK